MKEKSLDDVFMELKDALEAEAKKMADSYIDSFFDSLKRQAKTRKGKKTSSKAKVEKMEKKEMMTEDVSGGEDAILKPFTEEEGEALSLYDKLKHNLADRGVVVVRREKNGKIGVYKETLFLRGVVFGVIVSSVVWCIILLLNMGVF